ncbi:MAG: hypothetical protein E7Z91_01895 [Cyanobacteria bacterium SIG30]|nr:hypothetical protein [Cyanobacteria bacterium SIG30]
MIEFATIFIIFLSTVLVVLIKNADDFVIEYRKKLEIDAEVIIESVKEIRKSLKEINKIFRIIKEFQGFKFYKIIFKMIDVLNLLLLFYPAKKKITIAKRFLSIKALKQIFSTFKSLTA